MTTSHTESEFYLTFSELEPPVILEESEMDELESIDVLTKLKLVITPNFARAIIKTLSENIATFEKKAKGSDGE